MNIEKGDRFGRWTVLCFSHKKYKHRYYKCLCNCGKEKLVFGENLTRGLSKSCGCGTRDAVRKRNLKHNMTNTKTYQCWVNMRTRCNNPKVKAFKDYGGRGITVCNRWNTSFEHFLDDMGESFPGMEIERIDVNGGYCKENCKWITSGEQARNKRNLRWFDFRGKRMLITDVAKECGVSFIMVYKRVVLRGWDLETAVFTPPNQKLTKLKPILGIKD